MADTEDAPGDKEANKSPSPKPDQEVAPPLLSKDGEYRKTHDNYYSCLGKN